MDDFQSYRPLLFSIAYRMTGSASEAEDIVQETFLRARAASPADLRSAKAYLSTITSRLCLDYLKSARAQREQYIGPWLPEPLLTVDLAPELAAIERRDTISTAFLVLLEALSPPERAVFLLREVFEYEYGEIASMLGLSQANCRQLFHRAQGRLAERRPRFEPSREAQQRLVERFMRACGEGDVAALTDVLAQDVTTWSDGGGKVTAARNPIFGRDNVIRLLFGTLQKAGTIRASLLELNGGPAIVLFNDDTLVSATTFTIVDGRILGIHITRNPDKLGYLEQQMRVIGE